MLGFYRRVNLLNSIFKTISYSKFIGLKHILLLFSGFLPKGLQRLTSRLLNCLFAADTKGINYLTHKNTALAFLHCAGLKINHVTLAPNVGPSLKS